MRLEIFLLLLLKEKKIQPNGNAIDIWKLYHSIKKIFESEMSIGDRIIKEIRENGMMGGYNSGHLGNIELVPYEEGLAVVNNG
ncbi:hypothetical protein [Bacillus salipaludis]|uniref:Uncharacterized protein n=1 Tax=Bacillus salipaludis TaxID=2547811 RepID=A0AA90TWZ5_9BACI|nr:hypothetical protein [Bacillus salipaludis]MDQ6601070.1 hypothetical protein [Bacillus salipaludis]